MTSSVIRVDRSATVTEAARLMACTDVHRLLSDGDRAVGLLTSMDCLKAPAGHA